MATRTLSRNPTIKRIEVYQMSIVYKAILLVMILVPMLAVPVAMWQLWNNYASWKDVILLVVGFCLTACGVAMGLHRYFTHNSFTARKGVKLTLGVLALLAIEGPITKWVAEHRYHHAFSDTDEDLHSPLTGFWHAHMLWFFIGRKVNEAHYAKELVADPLIRMLDRLFLAFVLLSFLIPFVIGGWQGLLWGGLVRVFLVHHVSWGVNSICHTFGERPYRTPTNDRSSNVWWWVLGAGEQYHNTHHAAPSSARHGTGYLTDPTFALIRLMERLGWVSQVQVVAKERLAQLRVRP